MSLAQRFKELASKYGRVAIGVHLSVSVIFFSGCYLAINSSLDVESILQRVGLLKHVQTAQEADKGVLSDVPEVSAGSSNSSSAGDAGTGNQLGWNIGLASGGTVALALLCNKALLPLRVPITVALTPHVHRYLLRRGFKV